MKFINASLFIAISFCGNALGAEKGALDITTKNPIVRAAAQEHNSKTWLLSFPPENQDHIFKQLINISEPIAESIKNALNISVTCTYLNDLAYFGKLLRIYSAKQKDTAMKRLQSRMNDYTYRNNRRSLSLLIHAQAKHNVKSDYPLFERVLHQDDIDMAKLLLEYGAQVNEKYCGMPLFWQAKSCGMIQLLIDNGLNLNQEGECDSNVLWCAKPLREEELMKFYLEKGADPRKLDTRDGRSILHYAVTTFFLNNKKIISLLLAAAPDIINILDNEGKTALDYAYENKKSELIALLIKEGAKTAAELKSVENVVAKNQAVSCAICFDKEQISTIIIPCSNKHTESICLSCYEECLKRSHQCPLCRASLL